MTTARNFKDTYQQYRLQYILRFYLIGTQSGVLLGHVNAASFSGTLRWPSGLFCQNGTLLCFSF